MSNKFTITNPSYDKIHYAYAWEDNNRTLALVQGEGITVPDGAQANDEVTAFCAKAPRFQLKDKQGIIKLSADDHQVVWAVRRPGGSEDLVACNIIAGDNGVIEIPITTSVTQYAGEVHGEIRVITSNGVIKFYGINASVGDGVSDDATAQSAQYSALLAALQKVVALTSSGVAAMDNLTDSGDLRNGSNPVASGNLKTYLEGNYLTYLGKGFVKLRIAYPDSCTDDQMNSVTDGVRFSEAIAPDTLYIVRGGTAILNGDFEGFLLCARMRSNNRPQTQYHLMRTGVLRYRTRDNNEDAWGDWCSLESKANIDTDSLTDSDDKYPSSKLVKTEIESKVGKSQTVAGLELQGDIDKDSLARALDGSSVYYHEEASAPPTTVVAEKYPVPMLWRNTKDGAIYLVYAREHMVGFYRYGYFPVPSVRIGTNSSVDNISGVTGEIYMNSVTKKVWIYNTDTWVALVPDTRTIAGLPLSSNITRDELGRALAGSTIYYHTANTAPTNKMSDYYPAPIIWRDSSTGISYFSSYVQGSSGTYVYGWKPIAQTTYTFSHTLPVANWTSGTQTITVPDDFVLTGSDIMANINIDSVTQTQLIADGCIGIYLSATVTNSSLTITAHAIGNTPTDAIDIQVILTPVTDISE